MDTARTTLIDGLLTPVSIGPLRLRNRFAMAPMSRRMSPDGIPVAENAEYYRRRAAGGTALIVTEGTFIDDEAAGFSTKIPRMYGEETGAGWRAITDAVHGEGAAILAQLWHGGALRGDKSPLNPGVPARSPSGVDLDGNQLGEELTTAQIDSIIESYARAAVRAQSLGFDGIELHGAHGYLLDQFTWHVTNHRNDRYSRSQGAGTTFPVEVVRAVRDAVGTDFAIGYRFSQWKVERYRSRIAETPHELEAILAPIAEAGVDLLHASTRRHWLAEFPEQGDLSLAGWAKKVTGAPTMTVGSVGIDTPFGDATAPEQSCEDRLRILNRQFESGEFDVVALGRALLGDAAWVNKMAGLTPGPIDAYRPPDPATTSSGRTY